MKTPERPRHAILLNVPHLYPFTWYLSPIAITHDATENHRMTPSTALTECWQRWLGCDELSFQSWELHGMSILKRVIYRHFALRRTSDVVGAYTL